MRYALQWVRSLIFNLSMYLAMAVIGIVFSPFVLFSSNAAVFACHLYCYYVIWSARWMIGLKVEIRGTPPTHEAMVAAKHQSFLDVLAIYGAVPRGKFIMKRILMYAPVLGWFGLRVGCIPVDRGKRGAAIIKMLADVKAGAVQPGQLIIYPQGTRVTPGMSAKYKTGTGALYRQLGQPCVPVALNIGLFWPKRGVYRKPGTAVVEFLEEIPAGLTQNEFMMLIETRIEEASDRLNAEAGFVPHANA